MSKALASFVGLLALLLGATVSTQTKADSDFKNYGDRNYAKITVTVH